MNRLKRLLASKEIWRRDEYGALHVRLWPLVRFIAASKTESLDCTLLGCARAIRWRDGHWVYLGLFGRRVWWRPITPEMHAKG